MALPPKASSPPTLKTTSLANLKLLKISKLKLSNSANK